MVFLVIYSFIMIYAWTFFLASWIGNDKNKSDRIGIFSSTVFGISFHFQISPIFNFVGFHRLYFLFVGIPRGEGPSGPIGPWVNAAVCHVVGGPVAHGPWVPGGPHGPMGPWAHGPCLHGGAMTVLGCC